MTDDEVRSDQLGFQRRRFDRDAHRYDRHYHDAASQTYRTRFIRRPLLAGQLEGRRVLEAMSGSGAETGYLLEHGAEVIGLDVSPVSALLFRRRWSRPCLAASIEASGLAGGSFDTVYLAQGLHHVLPRLSAALREIHRLLKPGGVFCFVEPNARSRLDGARRLWYHLDRRFHDSERALDYGRDLAPALDLGFRQELLFFGGGPAYLLVAHSEISGVPQVLKRLIARPLMALEDRMVRLGRPSRLFFAGRWRRI